MGEVGAPGVLAVIGDEGSPDAEGSVSGGGGGAVMGSIEPELLRRPIADHNDLRDEAEADGSSGCGRPMGAGGEFAPEVCVFFDAGIIAADTGYVGARQESVRVIHQHVKDATERVK